MQVIAISTLKAFWRKHPQAQRPLENWSLLVRSANWRSPQDAKDLFGTVVDVIGDDRLVFDVAGNTFRLIVHVAYPFRRVLIKFVGTHAEYDRVDAETVGR